MRINTTEVHICYVWTQSMVVLHALLNCQVRAQAPSTYLVIEKVWGEVKGMHEKGEEVLSKANCSMAARCQYVMFGLHLPTQIHWTASFSFHLTSLHWSPCMIWSGRRFLVRYNLVVFLCMIWSHVSFVYDINLGATATMILSTRGVQIPIYLVTSATDSFRWSVVLFKSLSIPTSDLKSEFL